MARPPKSDPTLPVGATLNPFRSIGTVRPPAYAEGPEPVEAPGFRYELGAVLGAGGMGVVFRAYDRVLERSTAVKTLAAELSAHDVSVARFLAEARATARLEHPGIVPVHDLGETPDGRVFYAMREIRGTLLSEAIDDAHQRGPPRGGALRRLVDALRRVAETVAYAHAQGVVHRDLKPQNVMLGPFGEVLVLDWGLVRLPDGEEPTEALSELSDLKTWATRAGAVTGTPHYLAPEQARGEVDQIVPTTDVWALGCILHEILDGAPPYPDHPGKDAIAAAAAGSPLPPSGPKDLVAAAVRATAFRPADRHASALDFAAELRRWLDGDSRSEEALALVSECEHLEAEESRFRLRAAQHRAKAAALAAGLGPSPTAARRRALWAEEDAAASCDREAALMEARRLQGLHAALSRDPEHPDVRDALARYHLGRLREARLHRDEAGVVQHTHFLRAYDRGRLRRYADGLSSITLVTEPPGARVTLRPLVERDRQRVAGDASLEATTPVHGAELVAGTWLAELRHPDHVPVDLPIWLDPDTPFDTVPPRATAPLPIRLPRPAELGPNDVHVPAGWARLGPYTVPPGPAPDRVWVEAFVIRRDPVTQGEFLDFLNDLVRRGLEEDAVRHAPAERAARPDQPGRPCYGRDAQGRFHLVPDAEGDVWDLRWPVFLVDWFAARAYARWEAERTGLPWQLPTEAMWEKAARGVDGRLFPWGDRAETSFACLRGWRPGRLLPVPVDQVGADVSVYGVRGLAGNVRDWCLDAASPKTAAENDPLTERVVKGSAFFFNLLPLSTRLTLNAGNRGDTVGFRIARPLR